MAQSPDKSHAVIVLPPASRGQIARREHRRWLSRGRLGIADQPREMLVRTLHAIGHEAPAEGFAALRFWGQTGERSGAWMAAADPVHLEANLEHLRLHAFGENEISRPELRELFKSLQAIIEEDGRFAFARLGPLAYLRSEQPIATAVHSPDIVDGREAGEFMPGGADAAAHDLLVSELQMVLHEHAVNRDRERDGRRIVNSIWFWGGGTAPEQETRPIPPIFSDDPLFRGYWSSCAGTGNFWAEEIEDALAAAPDGFVAVAPDVAASPERETMTHRLEKLRLILRRGDLAKLTLLFRDQLTIEIGRRDVLRFWRKVSPVLESKSVDD